MMPQDLNEESDGGLPPRAGSPSSDTPETDALETRQSNEGCPQWNDMMRWVREHAELARKLGRERNALKAAVVEFMQIADEVADSRHGVARFLKLADELDERLGGILPENVPAVAPATLDAALPKDVMAG